jgi:hypothetical protein
MDANLTLILANKIRLRQSAWNPRKFAVNFFSLIR